MNRLTRDQILTRALDMIDSPSLDQKDRPAPPTISASALSIGWLQDGLDYFHHKYPFGATITTASIAFVLGQETYNLPADFVQDVKDGLLLPNDEGRCIHKGLSALLNIGRASTSQFGKPAWYSIVGTKLYLRPLPSAGWAGRTATLYYYQLPTALAGATVPTFPSDLVLVRYVYLRGMEWTRALPPGAAEKYADELIAALQRNGIGNEAEDDTVPFDRSSFPGNRVGSDPNSWMGSPIVG